MKHILYPDAEGRTFGPYELNDLCKGCRFLVIPQPSNIPLCKLEGLDPKVPFDDCIFRCLLPFWENPYIENRRELALLFKAFGVYFRRRKRCNQTSQSN